MQKNNSRLRNIITLIIAMDSSTLGFSSWNNNLRNITSRWYDAKMSSENDMIISNDILVNL